MKQPLSATGVWVLQEGTSLTTVNCIPCLCVEEIQGTAQKSSGTLWPLLIPFCL